MSKQSQRKPDGDRLFISSLAKGLEVLQCFGPTAPELSVSDISRITGMPQPTVWRICHTLITLGYLTNAQGRQTLRPGIPVLTLGYAALSSSPLGELALPDMQAIASKHSGAVSLGARNGLDMVYLQRCQGSAIILADLRVGSRVPIATSATGWAYIAGLGANAAAGQSYSPSPWLQWRSFISPTASTTATALTRSQVSIYGCSAFSRSLAEFGLRSGQDRGCRDEFP